MGAGRSEPSVCISDFNDITSYRDKYDGKTKNPRKIDKFNTMINDLSPVDLEYNRQQFSGCSNRRGSTTVNEHLDRALSNTTKMYFFSDG